MIQLMGQLLPCLLCFIQPKISLFRFSTGFCLISKTKQQNKRRALPFGRCLCTQSFAFGLPYVRQQQAATTWLYKFLRAWSLPNPTSLVRCRADKNQQKHFCIYAEQGRQSLYTYKLVTMNRGKHTNTHPPTTQLMSKFMRFAKDYGAENFINFI